MQAFPRYEELATLDRGVLNGLVAQYADPVWASTEPGLLRHLQTWSAAVEALTAAARGEHPDAVSDAPPAYLDRCARAAVEQAARATSWGSDFVPLRTAERLGLVHLDVNDSYVLALVGGLGGYVAGDRVEALTADPELLDRWWRVFEVEGGGEVSLANVDKFGRAHTWQAAVQEMVACGLVSRDRVLDAALAALQRDFSSYRAGWFSALVTALQPTAPELAARQDRLRGLLASQVTATVSLAARSLCPVSAAGLLDDDACAGLAPALTARTKGAAQDALRVLGEVAARRPDLREVVVATAVQGLDHPVADVQRATTALLARLQAQDMVDAAADRLAPSVALAATGVASWPDVAHPTMPVSAQLSVPGPVETAELIAALVEGETHPVVVERALAGLASHGAAVPLAPLAPRARKVVARRPDVDRDDSLPRRFAALVLTAGGRHAPGTTDPEVSVDPQYQDLADRLAEVDAVLAGHAPSGPLLATPSTEDGSLDGETVLARVDSLRRMGSADLRGALDRLTPADRTALGQRLRSSSLMGDQSASARAEVEAVLRAAERPAPARRLAPYAYPNSFVGSDGRTQAVVQWAFRVETVGVAPEPVPAQWFWRAASPRSWAAWRIHSRPLDTDAALGPLVLDVADAVAEWSVQHVAPVVLGALATHPGAVGPLGAAAIGAGLSAKRVTNRVLAVDAADAAHARGTLSAGALAEAMAGLAGACLPTRWAVSLAELAAADPPRTGPFVVDLLTALVPSLPSDDKGTAALLDVLVEESIRHHRGLADARLRDHLTGMVSARSAGRGAAAARRLLALGAAASS